MEWVVLGFALVMLLLVVGFIAIEVAAHKQQKQVPSPSEPVSNDQLLAQIRELSLRRHLSFESPARAVLAMVALQHDLPHSETPAGLSDVDIATGIVHRTVQHPHRMEVTADQYTGEPIAIFFDA